MEGVRVGKLEMGWRGDRAEVLELQSSAGSSRGDSDFTQETQVQVQALSSASSVMLSELHHFSEPHFLHLEGHFHFKKFVS